MTTLKFARLGFAIVQQLAHVKPSENVLVLGDTGSNRDIVDAIALASIGIGAETQIMIYPQRSTINIEPPAAIAEAMKATDVLIDLSIMYMLHTKAYSEARNTGTRCLVSSGSGIEDYMIQGITTIDYPEMVREGDAIGKLFETCTKCKVVSGQSNTIEMRLGNRPAIHRDGMVVGKGEIDYFPGSQISIAPIEDSINGTFLVNGSIFPPIGKIDQPVKITMTDGKITDVDGGTNGNQWAGYLKDLDDPKMYQVAHFSLGLNPAAHLSGNIFEDERIRSCVVFGFGSQMPDFKGNLGPAKAHTDTVILNATVFLDEIKVAEQGNILV
jgi:leucyl aminopeptidase (aminopeptidase T)